MKKICVIQTSLRENSNSDILSEAFIKGAREANNDVTVISLKGKRLEFCHGCLACQKIGHCVIQDDANGIANQVKDCDVIVFATPIYYYEMAGQMKTLLDRMNCLYGTDYQFREVYLLATAAEDEPAVIDRAQNGLDGWVACFPKAKLMGTVFAGGATAPGTIENHHALEETYQLGKTL